MSGLFASLSMRRAWETIISFLQAFSAPSAPSSSSGSQDDLEELRKLERTMYRIRATLHDAEEHWNIREETAKLRLQEIKEVAYAMEDVVDEYEYEVNRCKVEALERSLGNRNTGKRKYQEENEVCAMDMGVVAVPYDLTLRARKIIQRFNEIIDFSDHFTLSENDGERRFSPDISNLRDTGSFVVEKSILGRHQDREKIVEDLLSQGQNVGSPVSVMAIVGMGGLGKTTVAQLVYESPRLRQSFDKHAWVCVSENFNVITITRNIISSLIDGACEHAELDVLQRKLADEITDKKVLLVLDDVWNEQRGCWDVLCKPMAVTRVCQIVVTTRIETVARLIQTMPMYNLSHLSFDESWLLFKQVAFSVDQGSNNVGNMTEIGMKIVMKCKGLPLAIKTVGSMLRCETDEKIWGDVLENELLDLEKTRTEVLPILELCYKHMPIDLRRCFIALSLYPKDYMMGERETISLWKSLDLLNCNGGDDENETGSLYLKELVQRSILQRFQIDYYMDDDDEEDLVSYGIHDMVHDLACYLSAGEFYRLEGDTFDEIPQNARYISLSESLFKPVEIPVLPHSIRAFIVLEHYIEIINLQSLFRNCKNLRALDLCVKRSNLVDEAIGGLKLIRHLRLHPWQETGISISVPHLYNLNTLDNEGSDHFYPNVIAPRQIRYLVNLRSLKLFISRCACCTCNIRELRSINKIRKLTIRGLGSISCIEDANEAKMQSKKQLRSLYLDLMERNCCQHILQSEPVTLSHDQILESLQPHRSLTELTIQGYQSQKYPSWLGNDSFSKLIRISLWGFESKHLPPLGGLPSLKYLDLKDMQNVEYIGREFGSNSSKGFPSLTNIEFSSMDIWLVWSVVDDGDFVRLHTLKITNCHKLKSLPMVPSLVSVHLDGCDVTTIPAWPTLRELYIESCGSLTELPMLPSLLELDVWDCPVLNAVPALSTLTTLELAYCSGLNTVSSLPSLTTMKLHDCPVLNAVPALPKLTTLELRDCPGLNTVNSLPTLTTMKLHGCPNLSAVCALPSLTTLELAYCSGLNTVSSLPSLTTMKLHDCPNLSAVRALPSLITLHLNCIPNLFDTFLSPTTFERHPLEDELQYSLSNDLPSLELLEICRLRDTCLTLNQQCLPSLRRLCLRRCPDLQYCDGLAGLTSLQHLEIRGCPKLPIYNLHPTQLKTLIIEDEDKDFLGRFPWA